MRYEELKITEYNKLVGAKVSAPGGGNVLAMVLANAISLDLMVVNFTIEKKGYELLKEELIKDKVFLETALSKAYELANLDSESFNNVMTAYKVKDEKVLNKASIEAAQVPAQLLELTQSIEVISDFLSRKGNKTVVSDARIAFDLCKSIYNGCILNIKANLSGITDNKAKEKLNTIVELFSERI
jgi:formiminotetrahydrofolate cyclodeaminase